MKLIDEEEISQWAYEQCLKNDTKQMRRLITYSFWAYCYCRYVKDREEVWRKITESEWAYLYCKHVKDRPEVRRYIKDEINR